MVDLDRDLRSGHNPYSHASVIDLHKAYTPNFIEIEETFCGWLLTTNFKVT